MPDERSRRRRPGKDSGGSREFRAQECAHPSSSEPLPFAPILALPYAASAARPARMPEALFADVYATYAGRMRQIAVRITRNDADADDAVQDAFMRIYEKYGTFRQESSLWTWIYRITQTSALMILKKNRSVDRITHATKMLCDGLGQVKAPPTPEQALVQSRILDTVGESLERLRPSLRLPMRAYLREGLNQKDLCERFGLTTLATKARMHRARLILRRRMAPYLLPDRKQPA